MYNALKRTGISNVGEVLEMMRRGRDTMLSIRNFGEKSLEELALQLQVKGFLPTDYADVYAASGDDTDADAFEDDDFIITQDNAA